MNSIFNKIPLPWTFTRLRKLARVNPLVVNYHVVSDHYLPHVNNIYNYRDIATFTRDIDFLCSRFQIINLQQLLDHIKSSKSLPDNALLITIDDGLREVYDVMAPILKIKHIEPVLFLTKNYVDNKELGYDHRRSLVINKIRELNDRKKKEDLTTLLQEVQLFTRSNIESILHIPHDLRHMIDSIAEMIGVDYSTYLASQSPYITTPQIKELMNQGFTLGGHSVDHPDFSELTPEEQLIQAKESIDFVCDQFKVGYRVFAFPYWDAGVSMKFFRDLAADATFGTQGLLYDPVPNHIQRIGFERFSYSAQKSIKTHYFRKMLLSKLGRGIITRL